MEEQAKIKENGKLSLHISVEAFEAAKFKSPKNYSCKERKLKRRYLKAMQKPKVNQKSNIIKKGDDGLASVCNFRPRVLECLQDEAGDKLNLVIQKELHDGSLSQPIIVPLEELESFDWLKRDVRCRFSPKVPDARIRRMLADQVREQIADGVKTTRLLSFKHTGVHVVNGQHVFCTGDHLICNKKIRFDNMKPQFCLYGKKMDIDSDLPENEASSDVLELLKLFPYPFRMLIAYQILFIMRQVYCDAGIVPRFCIFLYGKTGTQKTTTASFLTQMYNRGNGIKSPTRLAASLPALVNILRGLYDEVLVLDDLFPAQSGQIRRKQEETLSEIIRYIADGVLPERIKAGKLSEGTPKCGVVLTGEYVIGNGSDAARILPVKMEKPDSTKLKYFQDHPLIISTFYYYFIIWYIEHYDELVIALKSWLNAYRVQSTRTQLGVHDRLQEAHMCLNTAYSLLLQYLSEKQGLTKQDALALQLEFNAFITNLVEEQDKRVQCGKQCSAEEEDYLTQLRNLYSNGQLCVTDDVKLFREDQHIGVIHNDCLCIPKIKLKNLFPRSQPDDVVNQLYCQGAIRAGKKTKTRQISELHGKRFLMIPLEKLRPF